MIVGVVGLGRMGAAIASRLIDAGFDVVVWNRTKERTTAFAAQSIKVLDTPAAVIAEADVVICMLTGADAVDAVYRGNYGILSGDISGKLVIEMSTLSPPEVRRLAADVAAEDADFVECPVGGTVRPALAGKLFGFVGAERVAFDRAKEILDVLCRRVEHVGPAGAGASVKLAINLPLAIYWQALGEAYSLCRHLDLDPAALVDVFADSSAGPNALRIVGADVARAFESLPATRSEFDCDLLRKDLGLMIEEGRSLGYRLPLSERVLQIYDGASAHGWGLREATELPVFWSSVGSKTYERGKATSADVD